MTLRLGSYYYALQLLSALSHPYHGAVTEVIDRAQALKKSDLHEPLHKVCFFSEFWVGNRATIKEGRQIQDSQFRGFYSISASLVFSSITYH